MQLGIFTSSPSASPAQPAGRCGADLPPSLRPTKQGDTT